MSHMQKTVKLTLKGKTFRKWASGQIIYEFEKEINPSGYSDPVLGLYIYMFMTFVVKQAYWCISQISGERLQDHWSSGLPWGCLELRLQR